MNQPFWQSKSLQQMTEDEWESLCDGCGRCCLLKLEDDETLELHFTRVSCHLLDTDTCRCRDYPHRQSHVPECLQVRRMVEDEYHWLPESCAYRRLAEGRDLARWHPLVSGRAESVVEAGISVRGKVISEDNVHSDDWPAHIIEFDPSD